MTPNAEHEGMILPETLNTSSCCAPCRSLLNEEPDIRTFHVPLFVCGPAFRPIQSGFERRGAGALSSNWRALVAMPEERGRDMATRKCQHHIANRQHQMSTANGANHDTKVR
jgi:hypothetical protein